ncbi:Glycosyltransferase [Quillaja saponaria]|uniref:Glycosyltransferase n=1 Tax=Quillaja saponaria TaxID=32244 RepID=A0AAD7L347_QUISA|nr:Glycosyltransferase [Quillaja saponaria]
MVELAKLILHHYSHKFSITILLTTGSFLDPPWIDSFIQSTTQSNPSISFRRFPPPRTIVANPNHIQAPMSVFDFIRSNSAYCSQIHQQTQKSFKDLPTTELQFPGLPPLKATQMFQPLLDRDVSAYWDVLYYCNCLPKSNGIIVNTFEELEPIALKAITDGLCVPKGPTTPPIYCIGPLTAEAYDDGGVERNDCLSWLDNQPSRSVLFFCFGSRGSFSVGQLKEIADGLEKSGQRFLWAVKNPPQDEKLNTTENSTDEVKLESILPERFLERTKDRGMVVRSWAPQVAVLRRESVGGFVTHCGWNSVLESVVAGVPMIAWPLYAEQHINRNVLVKDMKLAVGVEQRGEDGFVSGDEVERVVRELMESENGREMRERSWSMREMALDARGEFGSATKSLANLVKTWKGVSQKNEFLSKNERNDVYVL